MHVEHSASEVVSDLFEALHLAAAHCKPVSASYHFPVTIHHMGVGAVGSYCSHLLPVATCFLQLHASLCCSVSCQPHTDCVPSESAMTIVSTDSRFYHSVSYTGFKHGNIHQLCPLVLSSFFCSIVVSTSRSEKITCCVTSFVHESYSSCNSSSSMRYTGSSACLQARDA